MYYSDKPIILFQAWLPFSVVFVSAGGLSCGGMVSDTVPLSVCFMCSISMSEQFSELDRAESIDVTVMSTALSLGRGKKVEGSQEIRGLLITHSPYRCRSRLLRSNQQAGTSCPAHCRPVVWDRFLWVLTGQNWGVQSVECFYVLFWFYYYF